MTEKHRHPLSTGRRYQYFGYNTGFRVTYVAFRGHPEDDGGMEGVGIKWEGFPKGGRRGSVFIPCKSDEEFFDHYVFRNAYDVEQK